MITTSSTCIASWTYEEGDSPHDMHISTSTEHCVVENALFDIGIFSFILFIFIFGIWTAIWFIKKIKS